MSMDLPQFQASILRNTGIHKWNPNVKSELTLMSTAVKADAATTHDTTIQTAPGICLPGQAANTRYLNSIAKIVNKGRAGNLTSAQMGTAMDAVVALLP
jgi:hypothetical protein